MGYLFPTRSLSAFSRRNKGWTYGAFLLCLLLAVVRGYFRENRLDPYVAINFFDHWTGVGKDLFVIIVKFLYMPIGIMMWLLFVFIVFLWLAYVFAGLKVRLKFKEFVFSFLSLCYFGIILWGISFLLTLAATTIPYVIRLCIFFYWFSFYCALMIQEYGVSPLRSISVTVLSFLMVFPFGGFPVLAPYLQWI